jgi:RNA polymerase sigma factor (TIGR02999 family)
VTPGVPQLLERLRAGDESALNDLVKALYDELHLIAARHLRGERPGHTLQTTALVHEAYLKLIGDQQRGFADRVHFLSVVSRVMRQVLVDYARARATRSATGTQRFC